MLRSVETETVYARVRQRVEQVVDNVVLIILQACVHIGQLVVEVALHLILAGAVVSLQRMLQQVMTGAG